MARDRRFKEKVTVRFLSREDGGLQAVCDAIPGFYLSGRDPAAVVRDVIPAIEALMEHNLEIKVQVFPLKERLGHYEMIERDEDQIPAQQEYVLERVAAA
jgi:hypothetical protein